MGLTECGLIIKQSCILMRVLPYICNREGAVHLDPIGDKHVDAAEARTGNPVMFYAEPNKMFPAPRIDFNGR